MTENSDGNGSAASALDRLKSEATRLQTEATGLLDSFGEKAVASLKDSVEGAADRLTEDVKGGATPAVKAAAAGAKSLMEGKSPARSLLSAGTKAAKEKIGGMFRKSGGEGEESGQGGQGQGHQHSRVDRRGCTCPAGLRPVDAVHGLPERHEEGRER